MIIVRYADDLSSAARAEWGNSLWRFTLLRQRMHQSIREQGQWLNQIVGGYFRYHAAPINIHALKHFREEVVDRGSVCTAGAAKRATAPGPGLPCSLNTGFPSRASSTLGLNSGSPSRTRGRSHM
jgi:hypothetical protein